MNSPLHRYRTLDHWRGVAALAVLLFHAFAPLQTAIGQPWAQHTIGRGWLGVPLFFVISGYCIAERLSRDYGTGHAGHFLLDRARRLLPPYWATLVLLTVLRVAALPFNAHAGAPTWAAWWPAPLLLEGVLGREYVLPVAWSLAYEFTFYLVAAVLLTVAQLVRSVPVACALAALVPLAAWLPGGAAGRALALGWAQFLGGAVVWFALRPSTRPAARHAALLVLVAGAALAGATGHLDGALAGGFAATLVLAARWDEPLANTRLLHPLARVGAMSYSLYLVHVPLVGPCRNLLARAWPQTPAALIALATLAAAFAFGGAMVFHRFVEAPLERRRRAAAARSRAATASVSA